jgi:hypothetical protein
MPFLLLMLEALLFSRYLLINGNNVIPWDFRFWHLPHAVFVERSLRAGEFPLWNPYIYCGMPFAADVQTALFYPLRMAATLAGMALGESRMIYCLEADWILSMFLGGAFAYLLARALKMDKAPALMAASTYELGAFFASQAEHLGAIEIAAWLPLVWLAMVKLPSRRWCLLLSAALAMAVLAGFTPLTAVVFLSTVLLVRRGNIAQWAMAVGLAVLLAAVVVFPAAELRGLSVSRFRTDWMGTGGGLPLASLRTLFWANAKPVPGDITFQYIYCGAIGAALALTRLRSRWMAVAVAAAVLMLGDSTPVGTAFHGILPGFVQDAYYPQQWLGPFTLALALCAGLGLQWAMAKNRRAVALLPLAVAELIYFNSGRPFNLTTLTAEPAITAEAFNGSKELMSGVKAAAMGNRIDTLNDSIHWVASANITGIPTAGGQDPMALIRYMQVRDIFCNGKRFGVYYQVEDLGSPLLSAINVGAVVTRTKPPQPFREVPGGFVYLNEKVRPRFYLAGRTVRTGSMEESIARLRTEPETVTVEGAVAGSGTAGSITVERYAANSVALTVDAAEAAFLATSEPNYPGWKARIDGRPTEIFNTNSAFRGVNIPAGRHRIEFIFEPVLFLVSLVLSAISWAVWAVFLKRSI